MPLPWQTFYDQGVYTETLKCCTTPRKVNTPWNGASILHAQSLLRYWLASGGIDPDRDVSLEDYSPAQMVEVDLQAGSDGYCGGTLEPPGCNRRLAFACGYGLGRFGQDTQEKFSASGKTGPLIPTPTSRVKALLEACQYCADENNGKKFVRCCPNVSM